jgi:hypothetical protein
MEQLDVGFGTCPAFMYDAAPSLLKPPHIEIRIKRVRNKDSISSLIGIHHHFEPKRIFCHINIL